MEAQQLTRTISESLRLRFWTGKGVVLTTTTTTTTLGIHVVAQLNWSSKQFSHYNQRTMQKSLVDTIYVAAVSHEEERIPPSCRRRRIEGDGYTNHPRGLSPPRRHVRHPPASGPRSGPPSPRVRFSNPRVGGLQPGLAVNPKVNLCGVKGFSAVEF